MGLLLLQGSAALNPRELFASGEQGLWLDPSDFSTMWQDAAGDTPVTAASDPVALILDKSRSGPSMGSNQATNGTFDKDEDWTKGTGWTIGSGVATKTAGSASLLSQAQTMTVGRYYIVTYTITRTAGSITPQFAGGTTVSGTARSTSGTFTDIMTVVSGNNTLQLSADASFAGTVDNVSLKELSAGNHAYQTTSASRPTLARIPSSGRKNLLTYSEQFDNAAWTKTNTTASANTSETTDPIGTNTADKILETTATGTHALRLTATVTSGQNITFSFYAKAAGRNFVRFWEDVNTGKQGYFDLANGTATNSDLSSVTIQSVGNGWYRCSGTINSFAGTSYGFRVHVSTDGTTTSYAGDDTKGVYLWGAQLETGSTATSYQKVVATTDVTESGVSDLWHLVFDGSDDSLVTNAVDFSATDEMTVIGGLRKLSDAAQIIAELGTSFSSNTGSFYLVAGADPSNGYTSASRGTQVSSSMQVAASLVNQPDSSVLATTHDISSDLTTLRRNAVAATDATGEKGSGNFGNYQLFIGRRNQATLPLNGHIYQLIVRGKTTPTGKLLEAERFVARKTGVSF